MHSLQHALDDKSFIINRDFYKAYLIEDWNDHPGLVVDVKFTNEKQVEIEILNEKNKN
jgi:hypothetical protein